jgi:ADP-ribose pyrophosphatase YjhB (NUDIX family)/SAM-dependent methyltransferase
MAQQGRYIYEWPRPMVTADALVFADLTPPKVLLVRRANEPYKDKWAFPGGFIEMDEELHDAVARELKEETGLAGVRLEQMHTFGRIGRDPRGRMITVAFIGIVPADNMQVCPGDDAAEAKWFDIDDLPELAFDHNDVARMAISEFRKWKMNKKSSNGAGADTTRGEGDKLNELMWGYRSTRILAAANRMKLFSTLAAGPMSIEAICGKCGTKPAMTQKFLIACAAIGLVEKQGALYRNSPLADTYLVSGKPLYQGDMIAHSDHVRLFWDRLEEELGLAKHDKDETAVHHDFIMAMYNITMAGRGAIFTDNIGLDGKKRLLDVGGGPGTYSILACRKYPQLKATVFDLPETIKIARRVVAKESLADRIDFREGDWEKDDFRDGYDVVLLSNVMHGEGSLAEMKLAKAWRAMKDGGLVVVQEFLLNDDKTGPLTAALFNVMVGAYSQAELLAVISDAGFVDAKIVALDDRLGACWVTATKPNK